jgi:CelD/BcsL family acetyltransferase involved in cellulose biosynthesis
VTAHGVHLEALELRRIDSLVQLAELADPWRALHTSCAPESPFLSFDWAQLWAERFCRDARRLFVLAVYHEQRLVAVAPWCRIEPSGALRSSRIEFLGADVTAADHLDVLCQPGAARAVAALLHDHLFGPAAPLWHRLELRGVAADSPFLFEFSRKLGEAGRLFSLEAGNYCPTRTLQTGGQESLAGLLSRRRKRLRYELSVLSRRGAVEHLTLRSGEADAASASERFLSLYRARWEAGAEPLVGFTQQLIARAAQSPQLEIDLLEAGGRCVAGLLHLRSGEAIYLYLMAIDRTVDPRLSVGNLILGLALERAAKEGLRVYDFLRGGEDYKLRWADGASRDLDLVVHRRSLPAWLALAKAHLRELAKLLVR